MNRIEPDKSLPGSRLHTSSNPVKKNTLEDAENIDEILRSVGNVAHLVAKELPANIVLFVEPDKQDRLIELIGEKLSLPKGSIISKNIERINVATSIENIVRGLKEEINSAPGENVLVVIKGFEKHLLDTLGLDLKSNMRQPHDFLQGAHNNMAEGLQSYGINKRVITLTILDATSKQGRDLYFGFFESRFKSYIACVNL